MFKLHFSDSVGMYKSRFCRVDKEEYGFLIKFITM